MRSARVAGKYREFVPTTDERKMGILPGDEINALEPDFGRIGIAICFDLNFLDLMERWRERAGGGHPLLAERVRGRPIARVLGAPHGRLSRQRIEDG